MADYTVKAAGWLEDGAGIGAYRQAGDTVEFTETQAEYLLRSGNIEPAKPAAEKPAPKNDK